MDGCGRARRRVAASAIGKLDLLPHVPFCVLPLSATRGDGIDKWICKRSGKACLSGVELVVPRVQRHGTQTDSASIQGLSAFGFRGDDPVFVGGLFPESRKAI